MKNLAFAIIDFETTGMFANRDRIVEVAVVHMDGTGAITGRFETLLNPGRDLGPQSIHGIRAADILDAPSFQDIAGEVIDLLRGRVLAAHNAPFDCRFLEAELLRAGHPAQVTAEDALCTMRLARTFLPGAGGSLAACCAAFGIDLQDAHRAMADATATARLLASYLQEDPDHWAWREAAGVAARAIWPSVPSRQVPWTPRPVEATGAREPSPAAVPRGFRLQRGDRVVLTGEMKRPRERWHQELSARGLVPWNAVTKQVKLVVAADPDSLSVKARKAREYGVPIVGEDALSSLLPPRRSKP